jgi:phosphonate transport system substrate-binding protein
MKMIRFLILITLLFSFLNAKEFRVGVFPYTNALEIAKIYEPFSKFLSEKLNQNVEIYTSKSYEQFFTDVQNKEFDLIITAAHLGTLHIKDSFIPIYRYNTDLKPIFVVLKDSSINKISDLKNCKIALASKLSISSMGGIKALLDSGLQNEKDFTLISSKSHSSAIKSVELKEVDAAITTYTPIKQLMDETDIKDKIKMIESSISLPHLFTLANPDLGILSINELKKILKEFESSKEGKEFFKSSGYVGYIDISQNDINKITPLLDETKRFLNEK